MVHGALLTVFIAAVLEPLAGAEIAYLTGNLGQPPILLPERGWGLPFSVLVLLVFKDFLDYWFHRAQHSVPLLWSMHSFHHSDRALNVTTSVRHFWGDRALIVCLTYIPIGLVFRFGMRTAVVYGLVAMFFSLFPHMNLRIEFGRFSWILIGPQLHRTHHSILPKHHNANYSALFPVWDVLFGTYRAPAHGEFPETGIGEREPDNLWNALVWPFRKT